MSKRAIVFGSSGQLGVELVRELNTRGYAVHGFERKAIDIADRDQVEKCVSDLDPEVVLNAAAYNQVDVAEREPHAAYLANALAVRNLALACRQVDASGLLRYRSVRLRRRTRSRLRSGRGAHPPDGRPAPDCGHRAR